MVGRLHLVEWFTQEMKLLVAKFFAKVFVCKTITSKCMNKWAECLQYVLSFCLIGMDSRAETEFREEKARRPYAGIPERAGQLQQQVRLIYKMVYFTSLKRLLS